MIDPHAKADFDDGSLVVEESKVGQVFPIHPFPVNAPSAVLYMRKLADDEVNSYYDKHKFMPGTKTGTMRRLNRVTKEVVIAMTDSWEGFTQFHPHDVALPRENRRRVALPCTDKNKLKLLEQEYLVDGERRTLWSIVSDKLAEAEGLQEKN